MYLHAPMCYVRARARVRVCEWAPTHPRRHMRAPFVGMDRVWFGSQAFREASAFNANIGAWNTASVSNMQSVCAALSARAARQRGGMRTAGRRCGAGRGVPRRRRCARVCALACGHAHARVSPCVGIAMRSKDRLYVRMYVNVYMFIHMYICVYICVCVCVCVYMYTYISIYILYISIYIYMYALYMYVKVYMYLCERWVWACMWLHRLECTRACDCAWRRCGRCHRAHARVHPPGYVVNSIVMYIRIYLYRCQVRLCNWECVCVLAYSYDRVRALTMR